MPKTLRFFAPAFGRWLEARRGTRSLEWTARELRRAIGTAGVKVNRTNVQKWEQGRVPNWLILAGLSHVYDVPFSDLTLQLAEAIHVADAPLRSIVGHGGPKRDTRSIKSEEESQQNPDKPTGREIGMSAGIAQSAGGSGHAHRVVSPIEITLGELFDKVDEEPLTIIINAAARVVRDRRSVPGARLDRSGSRKGPP